MLDLPAVDVLAGVAPGQLEKDLAKARGGSANLCCQFVDLRRSFRREALPEVDVGGLP